MCYKDQENQHMCIYTVTQQTYEKTEESFTSRETLVGCVFEKALLQQGFL